MIRANAYRYLIFTVVQEQEMKNIQDLKENPRVGSFCFPTRLHFIRLSSSHRRNRGLPLQVQLKNQNNSFSEELGNALVVERINERITFHLQPSHFPLQSVDAFSELKNSQLAPSNLRDSSSHKQNQGCRNTQLRNLPLK